MTSAATISGLQHTIEKTNVWLKELAEEPIFRDELQAYSVLRAVLHALRDRLTIEEAAHFAAQLPMLVRGFYYEGWNPAVVPKRIRDQQEFLDSIQHEFRNDVEVDALQATKTIFKFLESKVSEGEIQDVKGLLPGPIAKLWD